MLFDEAFLNKIKEEPIQGILSLCQVVRDNISLDSDGWGQPDYEVLLEAYALVQNLNDMGLISLPYYLNELTGVISEDCPDIYRLVNQLQESYEQNLSKQKFDRYKEYFRVNLNESFCYEFSQGDLDKIQSLLNELREHISKSGDFADDHKRRLLTRLEKLQSELHKKMSDLDKFWGLIGDAGVAIGKFGNDVKPIVDRIKEITEIVWRTQARAEELPSDLPLPRLEDKTNHTDVA